MTTLSVGLNNELKLRLMRKRLTYRELRRIFQQSDSLWKEMSRKR